MTEPHEVWQLGRWIASREGGAARLSWTDGEMVVRLSDGRVRFVEGLDTASLARRLDCEPAECEDLLEEARTLARDREVTETHAMSAAKEVLQTNLSAWLLDPDRELELIEGEPDEVDGATISITHTLVELVLSDTSGETATSWLRPSTGAPTTQVAPPSVDRTKAPSTMPTATAAERKATASASPA